MLTAALALAWLIGVAWSAWQAPLGPAAGALAAATVTAICYRGRPLLWPCLALVGAGVALLAAARWQFVSAPPPPSSVHWLAGGPPVRLEGVIRSRPEERGTGRRLIVDATRLDPDAGDRRVEGGIQIRTTAGRPLRAGDRVLIEGQLIQPPRLGRFDYPAYLARRGVVAQMDYPRLSPLGQRTLPWWRRSLEQARAAASGALTDALPQPEAALAEGIITGNRAQIPATVIEDFNRSGLTHLIAISGFNLSIIAAAIVGTLTPVCGRRRAAPVAIVMITLYAVFAGLSPSVARAWVMGMLVAGHALLGRPGTPLLPLLLAAVAMTGHDPRVLTDAGFQLSFSATAGILLLTPPLQRGIDGALAAAGRGWSAPGAALGELLIVTVAATVATLPVMLCTFGRISLIAPLANLLAAPVFPLVIGTSAVAAVTGVLTLPGADLAGAIAQPPLTFTIAVARITATIPGASLTVPPLPGWAALLLYGVGGIALWQARRHSVGAMDTPISPAWHSARSATPALLAVVPSLLVLGYAATGLLDRDPLGGTLSVAPLESGAAASALLRGPAGERILVAERMAADSVFRSLDPLLRDGRRLDLIVLTSSDPVNPGELRRVIDRYQPGLLAARPSTVTDATEPLPGIRFIPITTATTVRLGRGARLELQPDPTRPARLAVLALVGQRSIALSGVWQADAVIDRPPGGARGDVRIAIIGMAPITHNPTRSGPLFIATDGNVLRMHTSRGRIRPGQPGPVATAGVGGAR